jgi:anti-sigma B factor antagonist
MSYDDHTSPVTADEQTPELAIQEERGLDWTVLSLAGELDAATAPRLAASFDDIVMTGRGVLTVDARELEFIDSTGLHVLLNAQRRLTRQSRQLRVICAPGAVRRAIELSRLTETLGLVAG